ncbi:hypothetical protein AGMMS50268_41660 [Spirochaetia bacterium]|nr:hypothetical protein AGMMS50268_41660 [Spirochaetia bacterium]
MAAAEKPKNPGDFLIYDNEEIIITPQRQNIQIYKNILYNKGITVVLINEKYLPDVQGIPPGYDAYGRGGVFKKGGLFLDGGMNGSANGHPNDIIHNFYWAVTYEKSYIDPYTRKGYPGIIYISGKNRDSEKYLVQNKETVIQALLKRLPENRTEAFIQFKKEIASRQSRARMNPA